MRTEKKNQLVYNWIFIPVWNECGNGYFKKKTVEINRGLVLFTLWSYIIHMYKVDKYSKLELGTYFMYVLIFVLTSLSVSTSHGEPSLPIFICIWIWIDGYLYLGAPESCKQKSLSNLKYYYQSLTLLVFLGSWERYYFSFWHDLQKGKALLYQNYSTPPFWEAYHTLGPLISNIFRRPRSW